MRIWNVLLTPIYLSSTIMLRSAIISAWLNMSPNKCPIHKNILVIYKTINMNIGDISSCHLKLNNFGALGGGSLVARRPLSFLLLLALPPCSVPTGASLVSLGALWVPTDVECVQLVVLHCGFLPVSHSRLSGRYYAPPHCFGCPTVIYNHVLI